MRIAVVIPTLDEAASVEAAIASAGAAGGPISPETCAREPAPLATGDRDIEVWVVDGGSRDATVARARAAGACVLSAAAGRARQQEAGWRASRGDAVVFLHADTRLPAGWAGAVRGALSDPHVAGGAFRLRYEPRPPAMAVIEWGARVRARLLGLPYGDQALFARRGVLEAIGGVPAVPIFEDLDLVRALRRRGRFAQLPLAVATSSRRYLRRGVLRTFGRHALALAAWRLGLDRERVADWVRR
ncbi:MAG: TIGR04283 family arsenosugar biosynthesis glycosyltransferase [Deltaproteobacteria bacterium]|nr:TIGR04283 family arsenosugar biosynthesis glycosyltransferase [Deltaproteobacteria bacterium]